MFYCIQTLYLYNTTNITKCIAKARGYILAKTNLTHQMVSEKRKALGGFEKAEMVKWEGINSSIQHIM